MKKVSYKDFPDPTKDERIIFRDHLYENMFNAFKNIDKIIIKHEIDMELIPALLKEGYRVFTSPVVVEPIYNKEGKEVGYKARWNEYEYIPGLKEHFGEDYQETEYEIVHNEEELKKLKDLPLEVKWGLAGKMVDEILKDPMMKQLARQGGIAMKAKAEAMFLPSFQEVKELAKKTEHIVVKVPRKRKKKGK